MQETLTWKSRYTNGCQKLDFGIVNKMFKSKKKILVENLKYEIHEIYELVF